MKVVKEGSLERIKAPKYFSCSSCGCAFIADSGEYWSAWVRCDK